MQILQSDSDFQSANSGAANTTNTHTTVCLNRITLLDITESIDRLARSLEARFDLRDSPQPRNNPKFRHQTPFQRNQSSDRFQNQQRTFQNNFNRNNYTNGNQNNWQNRSDYPQNNNFRPNNGNSNSTFGNGTINSYNNRSSHENRQQQHPPPDDATKDNDQMETITGNILNVRMIHDLRTMIEDNKPLISAPTTWQTSKMTYKQSHNFLRKTKTNDLRKNHFRNKVFNSREYSISANYFTARLFTWHFITNQSYRRRYLATIQRNWLTSIVRIQGEQVSVLFDEGSQVNVISTKTAKRLALTTKSLLQPRRLLFPNG